MFYNLKIAFNNLGRNRLYSVLNIAGLSVGIAAATLIFLWANHYLRYNRDFPNADNIYEIGVKQRYGDDIYTFFVASGPLSATLDETFPEIIRNARVGGGSGESFRRENSDQFFSGYGSFIDSTIFTMLRMEFVRGDPATAFAADFSMVISEKMAKRCFDDDDPLGKTLQFGETDFYEVTGVYKDVQKNSSFSYEWMAPFSGFEKRVKRDYPENYESWQNYWINLYVEIGAHTDVNGVNQKLKSLLAEKTGGQSDSELLIYPVTKRMLYKFQDGVEVPGYISEVRLFLCIGGLILLIACINFMNLATARSKKRALEVGVRKTFGAGRFTLISQFLGEASVITGIALMIAVVLVFMLLPSFNELISMNLTFDFSDWNNWARLLVIGVICSLLAGSYPAFYLSSFSPIFIFQRMKIKIAGSVIFVRKGLVIFQFVAAFVLICATFVIYLQIRHAQNRDIGFDRENLVRYWVPENIGKSYVAIQHELMASGFVENTGMCEHSLFQIWSNGGGMNWQGKSPETEPLVSYTAFTPGLIETAKLTIEEGRDFAFGDDEKDYIIINRALADLMGEAGHAGGRIWWGDNPESYEEIIGIVNDFVFNNAFQTKADPLRIRCNPHAPNLYIRLKPNVPTGDALAQINNILQKFSPNNQFNAVFMDDSFKNIFSKYFIVQKLSLLFAALAIFISCLGLFGLSSFSAEQRTKEIGIRKTLGASIWSLINLLINNFFVLIGISFVIAIPIAWYVTHSWLSDFPYRIKESWLLFAAVGALVIVIVIFTVGFQALRAALADPIKSISSSE
ncbi:MAG: ABC transporter permease [Bacteroidales bacterium]|nr:ABC transporter permease [Bacteroidales bacterium]